MREKVLINWNWLHAIQILVQVFFWSWLWWVKEVECWFYLKIWLRRDISDLDFLELTISFFFDFWNSFLLRFLNFEKLLVVIANIPTELQNFSRVQLNIISFYKLVFSSFPWWARFWWRWGSTRVYLKVQLILAYDNRSFFENELSFFLLNRQPYEFVKVSFEDFWLSSYTLYQKVWTFGLIVNSLYLFDEWTDIVFIIDLIEEFKQLECIVLNHMITTCQNPEFWLLEMYHVRNEICRLAPLFI